MSRLTALALAAILSLLGTSPARAELPEEALRALVRRTLARDECLFVGPHIVCSLEARRQGDATVPAGTTVEPPYEMVYFIVALLPTANGAVVDKMIGLRQLWTREGDLTLVHQLFVPFGPEGRSRPFTGELRLDGSRVVSHTRSVPDPAEIDALERLLLRLFLSHPL